MITRTAFRKAEFEYRIFFSLGIVAATCALAAVLSPHEAALGVTLGTLSGWDPAAASCALFACGACAMLASSLLRMWAGSMLSARRVMSFRVQPDALNTKGPYRFSRNPIYLADWLAMCVFALCLPPVGLLMPALFLVHYLRLIRYEEEALLAIHGNRYEAFMRATPRLVPAPASLRTARTAFAEWCLTAEGVRHNALYVLFIPGFLVAMHTGSFVHAALIGVPAVIDWAVVHTRIGRPKKVFTGVLYAQCWEDPSIDRAAFALESGAHVFTITSGGDNALAFLLDDPAHVTALDLNPRQNHMLELKIAALRTCTRDELLAFCGATEGCDRRALYARMRPLISAEARACWDAHRADIRRGILHAGRYERYMRLIRRALRLALGGRTLDALFDVRTRHNRAAITRALESRRWRWLTRVLLSRRLMSWLFTPDFFAWLEEDLDFGAHFSSVARRAFLNLPVYRSPFLSYILRGTWNEDALPVWLQRDNWETVRARTDRITCVSMPCEQYFASLPDDSFDAFNFTNIFEWMPGDAFHALLRETVRTARDGAVITYRNLLVPRSRPAEMEDVLVPDAHLAQRLHAEDLSFIYRAYHIEHVVKSEVVLPAPCDLQSAGAM